jgi:hypothetical protein
MAQTDLQDALMEWLLDAPVSRKHFTQELERLLRRLELEAYMAGFIRAPYTDGAADTRILQALKDENDG